MVLKNKIYTIESFRLILSGARRVLVQYIDKIHLQKARAGSFSAQCSNKISLNRYYMVKKYPPNNYKWGFYGYFDWKLTQECAYDPFWGFFNAKTLKSWQKRVSSTSEILSSSEKKTIQLIQRGFVFWKDEFCSSLELSSQGKKLRSQVVHRRYSF